jgi:hypothetical protein
MKPRNPHAIPASRRKAGAFSGRKRPEERVHFAHPDEEATFNRCRVYYHGQCEETAATVQCSSCRTVAVDTEPYAGRDHHEAHDALRERLAAVGWTMRCGLDWCAACS